MKDYSRHPENNRETGARKLTLGTDTTGQQVSQEAAENRAPNDGMGLTEDEPGEQHGDNVSTQPIEKVAGAGPAIARHSKDAQ